MPGIINQLGPDSLASLRKLAESYQAMQGANRMGGIGGPGIGGPGAVKSAADDDDEVPDLVENFEVDDAPKGQLEELN